MTINELLDKQQIDIFTKIGNWTQERLGREFHSILQHQFFLQKSMLVKELHIFHCLKDQIIQ